MVSSLKRPDTKIGIYPNAMQCNAMQRKCNAIKYNTTSFISNIEQNNIATICTQHWDGWKGGGQKNNPIMIHPQH